MADNLAFFTLTPSLQEGSSSLPSGIPGVIICCTVNMDPTEETLPVPDTHVPILNINNISITTHGAFYRHLIDFYFIKN